MDRPDIIPVRSSEVLRRCKIDITQWRNADDVQREAWRNIARAQIMEESKTTGASLTDRVGSSETRLLEVESKIESLTAELQKAIESANNRDRELSDEVAACHRRISQLPQGGNTP